MLCHPRLALGELNKQHSDQVWGNILPKDFSAALQGSCKCGTCSFEIEEAPKARLICHCTICQSFTGNAYSDVVIVPVGKARLHNIDQASFRFYKKQHWPPPNLNRGWCKVCDRPVVEVFGSPPLKILFIPSINFSQQQAIPRAGGHMFYESRQSDIDDDLPKHCGYMRSQIAIVRLILRAM